MAKLDFDPSIQLMNRKGDEQLMLSGNIKATTGELAIQALDFIEGDAKADKSSKMRRFRISGEIYDAMTSGSTVKLADDEIDEIDKLILASGYITLLYGRWQEALKAMKDTNIAAAKPNGAANTNEASVPAPG